MSDKNSVAAIGAGPVSVEIEKRTAKSKQKDCLNTWTLRSKEVLHILK